MTHQHRYTVPYTPKLIELAAARIRNDLDHGTRTPITIENLFRELFPDIPPKLSEGNQLDILNCRSDIGKGLQEEFPDHAFKSFGAHYEKHWANLTEEERAKTMTMDEVIKSSPGLGAQTGPITGWILAGPDLMTAAGYYQEEQIAKGTKRRKENQKKRLIKTIGPTTLVDLIEGIEERKLLEVQNT